MTHWPEPGHWPLLFVSIWRPPVAGLEHLGYQWIATKLYEVTDQ